MKTRVLGSLFIVVILLVVAFFTGTFDSQSGAVSGNVNANSSSSDSDSAFKLHN